MSASDIPDRFTVDGVQVKRGDVVWRIEKNYGAVRKSRIMKSDMGWAWPMKFDGLVYASHDAAIHAAIELAEQRLNKAKRDVQSEKKCIERLKARLVQP
jgi:hypothetical protein